jgi:carbonic anhydrase/acetyltransferase-like protein (isoleucine patch superfamily)
MTPHLRGLCIPYGDAAPQLHPSVYLAPGAVVIGDVTAGEGSSIWFNAVVRGDVNPITLGRRVNVQDLSVIHVTHERWSTTVGDDVTIGHRAILHGCTLGHRVLIGMGAIVMDGAHIADDSIVAAGALVPPGATFPPGSLILGSPARLKRPLSEDERRSLEDSASRYARYAQRYMTTG